MSKVDLVVVGAGPFGLIAAHTWLELNSHAKVVILESDADVGGAWSKTRVYPGMMTQTPVGMLEFSHTSLPRPLQTFHDYMNAEHVTDYLESFCRSKQFDGKTIRERIQFNSQVTRINKEDDLWMVQAASGARHVCQKLIVATGLTSTPHMPASLQGEGKPLVIHSKYLAKTASLLLSSHINNVVVLGGSKSAFDAAYMLCHAGKNVSWIIRTQGQGPATMAPPDAPFLKNSHEALSMRLVSKMSPCIFDPQDAWSRFFHRSRIGIWIVDGVWSVVDWMYHRAAGYDRSSDMEKLRPDRPAFWTSDSIGVSNCPDLWETLKKAKVCRGDVIGIDDTGAVLSSGEKVECDALIACTGWSASYPMFSTEDAQAMGLPVPISSADEIPTTDWQAQIARADKEVLHTFPRLSNPPAFADRKLTTTPTYLYRGMIPANSIDHSIVFLGAYGTTQSMLVGEIQSLWAAAYLSDRLSLPEREKMEEDVALSIAWRRRRYLADGRTINFDQIPYLSMLVRDLGLNDLRKGGGWRELLQPYRPRDYRGILDEWKASQRH